MVRFISGITAAKEVTKYIVSPGHYKPEALHYQSRLRAQRLLIATAIAQFLTVLLYYCGQVHFCKPSAASKTLLTSKMLYLLLCNQCLLLS